MSLYKGNNLISGAMPNSANQSLSNLDSAGQDKFDAKVNKSGDTMTGTLSIDSDGTNLNLNNPDLTKGTNPSSKKYLSILMNDGSNSSPWQAKRLGKIELQSLLDGTERIVIAPYRNVANSTDNTAFAISIPQSGDGYCSFPNTTCCDGQWVYKLSNLENGTYPSGETTHTYSLSDYLPSDNYNYEILVSGRGNIGTTGILEVFIKSQIFNGSTGNTPIVYRAQNSGSAGGTVLIAIGSNRQLIRIAKCSSKTGNVYLDLLGYRRIGLNA